MSLISLTINGVTESRDLDPDMPLLDLLSQDLDLRGPKLGCGLGQCGACTALVDGNAMRTCVTPVRAVDGATIVTLEGLGTPEAPHPIQQAFIDEQAAQCGFCLSGVVLTAKALLDRQPDADDTQVRQALGGVLCRCFVHTRIMRAIRRYADGRTVAVARAPERPIGAGAVEGARS